MESLANRELAQDSCPSTYAVIIRSWQNRVHTGIYVDFSPG